MDTKKFRPDIGPVCEQNKEKERIPEENKNTKRFSQQSPRFANRNVFPNPSILVPLIQNERITPPKQSHHM